ncbi:MAG: hypothetical protein JWQ60_660 [Pseudonocardia sp.]|nr:hypothetical protein [Pseudonocardia sp.]
MKADIGGRPATVIVEPDALPAADCTGPGGRTARFAAMADAVSGFDETTAAPDAVRGALEVLADPASLMGRRLGSA